MASGPRSQGAVNAGKPARLKFSVVNGAAADTDITVTGFKRGRDQVLSILHFNVTAGDIDVLTDKTSELQAGTAVDAIQLSTTATTGDTLLVVWLRGNPG